MVCEECGARADEQADGWRALHGEEDDGTLVTVVFCPECATQEFGGGDRVSRRLGD